MTALPLGERIAGGLAVGACAAEWVDAPWLRLSALGVVAAAAVVPGGFAALAALAAAAFVAAPLALANHAVVAGWLCAALAWSGDDPPAHRSLYAAILGAATLQKLASPTFVDGSFPAYLAVTGGLARPVVDLYPALAAALDDNAARVAAAGMDPVVLRGPPGLWVGGVVGAWAVIGVEAALAVTALRAPRAWLPLAAAFVVGLAVVRDEWVFCSILAVVTALGAPAGRARAGLLAWGVGWALASTVWR